jgi:hypothetical protein
MRTVAIIVGLSLAATAIDAGQLQSLGDAAKRAEERRKASEAPPSFTVRDLVDVEWMITRPGFEDYAAARAEIGAIRRRNLPLHQKLFNASRTASSLADLAPVLSSEPSIVGVLGKYGLNSREYLRREQAYVNATAWAARRLPDSIKERPIRMQNVEFVRNNGRFMRETAARYQKAEGAPPWFNPGRFIEQP